MELYEITTLCIALAGCITGMINLTINILKFANEKRKLEINFFNQCVYAMEGTSNPIVYSVHLGIEICNTTNSAIIIQDMYIKHAIWLPMLFLKHILFSHDIAPYRLKYFSCPGEITECCQGNSSGSIYFPYTLEMQSDIKFETSFSMCGGVDPIELGISDGKLIVDTLNAIKGHCGLQVIIKYSGHIVKKKIYPYIFTFHKK